MSKKRISHHCINYFPSSLILFIASIFVNCAFWKILENIIDKKKRNKIEKQQEGGKENQK